MGGETTRCDERETGRDESRPEDINFFVSEGKSVRNQSGSSLHHTLKANQLPVVAIARAIKLSSG